MGGTVLLSVDVWDDEPQGAELRLWFDDSETLIPMGRMDRSFDPEMGQMDRSFDPVRFTAEFEPPHPGVYWYSFRITAADGSVWSYGAREEGAVGEGAGETRRWGSRGV